MHALADCIKTVQGMTGKDRNSPATKDLQRIVDATQAQIKAQSNQFEHAATPTDTPQGQQVPRVQTTAGEPIPYTDVNRRVPRSISINSKGAQLQQDHQQTVRPTHQFHKPNISVEMVHGMTIKHRTYDQQDTMHTDTSSGGYGGSTSNTPSLKHRFARTTVYFTATATPPGIQGGHIATTTTSTQHGLTLSITHL